MSTFYEFFKFTKDASTWTMTSADEAIIHDSEYYRPTPISRSDLELRDESSKSELQLTLPLSNDLASTLMDEVPLRQNVALTVFRRQDEGAVETIWKGRLASIRPDKKSLALQFESIFTSLRRTGLRQRYQRSCRHALYGRGCGVDPDDHTTNMLISAISGRVYTLPNASLEEDHFYTGGMLRSAAGELTYISSQIGALVTVNRLLQGVSTMDYVDVISGCDHTIETCNTKFSNFENYGGFNWIPTKNPLNGNTSIL